MMTQEAYEKIKTALEAGWWQSGHYYEWHDKFAKALSALEELRKDAERLRTTAARVDQLRRENTLYSHAHIAEAWQDLRSAIRGGGDQCPSIPTVDTQGCSDAPADQELEQTITECPNCSDPPHMGPCKRRVRRLRDVPQPEPAGALRRDFLQRALDIHSTRQGSYERDAIKQATDIAAVSQHLADWQEPTSEFDAACKRVMELAVAVCPQCGHAPHNDRQCGAELPEGTPQGSHCSCGRKSEPAVVSAMYHHKYGPSTDMWTCVHGVSAPDLCQQCAMDSLQMDLAARDLEIKNYKITVEALIADIDARDKALKEAVEILGEFAELHIVWKRTAIGYIADPTDKWERAAAFVAKHGGKP